MRGPDGSPTVRVRLLALLLAVGMLLLAAPALVPLLRWLADLVV
jgi:hypothetical protein